MAQGQLGRNPWLCCRSPGPASQLPGPVGCWLGFVGKVLQYCSATPEGTRDLGFPVWTAYLIRAWTVQCITAKCITAPTHRSGSCEDSDQRRDHQRALGWSRSRFFW